MHDLAILAIHLIATIAKLLLPGGARSVLSESLLLKHQLLILNRYRSWGLREFNALANLGHDFSRGTIANVLSEHGIAPAHERGKDTSWATFLKAHWGSIAAIDSLTVEVLTLRGLVTHYVLFVLDLASRTVKIAGSTRIRTRRGW